MYSSSKNILQQPINARTCKHTIEPYLFTCFLTTIYIIYQHILYARALDYTFKCAVMVSYEPPLSQTFASSNIWPPIWDKWCVLPYHKFCRRMWPSAFTFLFLDCLWQLFWCATIKFLVLSTMKELTKFILFILFYRGYFKHERYNFDCLPLFKRFLFKRSHIGFHFHNFADQNQLERLLF